MSAYLYYTWARFIKKEHSLGTFNVTPEDVQSRTCFVRNTNAEVSVVADPTLANSRPYQYQVHTPSVPGWDNPEGSMSHHFEDGDGISQGSMYGPFILRVPNSFRWLPPHTTFSLYCRLDILSCAGFRNSSWLGNPSLGLSTFNALSGDFSTVSISAIGTGAWFRTTRAWRGSWCISRDVILEGARSNQARWFAFAYPMGVCVAQPRQPAAYFPTA